MLKNTVLMFIVGYLVISPSLSAQELTAEQIAQDAYQSVVTLFNEDSNGQPRALGSGFFIDGNIVATNFHVIDGAVKMEAKFPNSDKKYPVIGVLGSSRKCDLALLKVGGITAPPLSLEDIQNVNVGNEVYAVGSPEGLEGTFSKGIISALRSHDQDSVIQIDAAVWHGSSGGPLLNKYAKVVGITFSGLEVGQNLNFAVPVSKLLALINENKPLVALSTNMTILYAQGIPSYDDMSESDPVLLILLRKAGSSQKISLLYISLSDTDIKTLQKQYNLSDISVIGWSKKIQDNPNPVWNESIPIFNYEPGDEIMIMVYDKDLTKAQIIGYTEIMDAKSGTYQILRPLGNGQFSNQGLLTVQF